MVAKTRMWKDGTRRGIVYVEERDAAEKVMALRPVPAAPSSVAATTQQRSARQRRSSSTVAAKAAATITATSTRHVAPPRVETELAGAMAVYLDRKGKPFAWQIPFDIADWDRVTALVGAPEPSVANLRHNER